MKRARHIYVFILCYCVSAHPSPREMDVPLVMNQDSSPHPRQLLCLACSLVETNDAPKRETKLHDPRHASVVEETACMYSVNSSIIRGHPVSSAFFVMAQKKKRSTHAATRFER
ncbi:hypothetical protein BC567DRAFT_64143 [Phyllosticta citribraziliensis]